MTSITIPVWDRLVNISRVTDSSQENDSKSRSYAGKFDWPADEDEENVDPARCFESMWINSCQTSDWKYILVPRNTGTRFIPNMFLHKIFGDFLDRDLTEEFADLLMMEELSSELGEHYGLLMEENPVSVNYNGLVMYLVAALAFRVNSERFLSLSELSFGKEAKIWNVEEMGWQEHFDHRTAVFLPENHVLSEPALQLLAHSVTGLGGVLVTYGDGCTFDVTNEPFDHLPAFVSLLETLRGMYSMLQQDEIFALAVTSGVHKMVRVTNKITVPRKTEATPDLKINAEGTHFPVTFKNLRAGIPFGPLFSDVDSEMVMAQPKPLFPEFSASASSTWADIALLVRWVDGLAISSAAAASHSDPGEKTPFYIPPEETNGVSCLFFESAKDFALQYVTNLSKLLRIYDESKSNDDDKVDKYNPVIVSTFAKYREGFVENGAKELCDCSDLGDEPNETEDLAEDSDYDSSGDEDVCDYDYNEDYDPDEWDHSNKIGESSQAGAADAARPMKAVGYFRCGDPLIAKTIIPWYWVDPTGILDPNEFGTTAEYNELVSLRRRAPSIKTALQLAEKKAAEKDAVEKKAAENKAAEKK